VALLCFSFFVSAHGRFNRSRAIDSYTADEKTAEERNPIADSQAYTYPRARLSPSLKQAAPPSPLVCLSPSVSLSPSLCARWQRGGGGAGSPALGPEEDVGLRVVEHGGARRRRRRVEVEERRAASAEQGRRGGGAVGSISPPFFPSLAPSCCFFS
jgi:hypothetical protein